MSAPRYISEELFHFFGRATPRDHERNYALLKTVLNTGCISHPPHEVGWGTISYTLDISKRLAREEMLVPTVTCYCDIPYDHLGAHTSKYGDFGLSFSRHNLTKAGARPVIYVPCRPDDWAGVFTGHTQLRELESTFVGIHEQRKILAKTDEDGPAAVTLGVKAESAVDALAKAEHSLALRVLAFIKPYDSMLEESDPSYYYSEREWRKLGNFVFESTDVLRIVVSSDFVDRARNELPQFSDRIHAAIGND